MENEVLSEWCSGKLSYYNCDIRNTSVSDTNNKTRQHTPGAENITLDPIAASYDKVAENYDMSFNTVAALCENNAVMRTLANDGILRASKVVDLGCGTGILLGAFGISAPI